MIAFRMPKSGLAVLLAATALLALTGWAWAGGTKDSVPLRSDPPQTVGDNSMAYDNPDFLFSQSFSYLHVAGSTLRPRDSALGWDSAGSGGCVYQTAGSSVEVFNIHMDIPEGSRVDYLRIYFYDTSGSDSTAWLTSYDDAGSFSDIASVSSSGTGGYGTGLSAYLGQTLDYFSNSYVLNWRSNDASSAMRLCGLRLAYRLPTTETFLPSIMRDS